MGEKKTWIAISREGMIIGHGYEPYSDSEKLVVAIMDKSGRVRGYIRMSGREFKESPGRLSLVLIA